MDIKKYLPIIKRIAGSLIRSADTSVQYDDLVQAGSLGFLAACTDYEQEKGASFRTYADIRIKGAMLDEIRRFGWISKTPYKQYKAVLRTKEKLINNLFREPSASEVAQELNINLVDYNIMMDELHCMCIHHDSLIDPDEMSFDEDTVYDATVMDRYQRDLGIRISRLRSREREIIGLYYNEGLHLREIGEQLSLTESRICTIHKGVLAKLHDGMRYYI